MIIVILIYLAILGIILTGMYAITRNEEIYEDNYHGIKELGGTRSGGEGARSTQCRSVS